MTARYSDAQYKKTVALLKEREGLIDQIADISKTISHLEKMREQVRTKSRTLKSAAIAYDVGVSQCWVEKISEGKIVRADL